MRLLVTGGAGFLGAAVVTAAVRSGWSVGVLARQAEPTRLNGVTDAIRLHQVDLADREDVRAVLAREAPDVVVHSAWAGLNRASRSSSDQVTANLLPTLRLVEDAAAAGASKFIGIGSQAEYGLVDRRMSEEDKPAPNSFYGAAKLAALHLGTAAAAHTDMAFAWLRLFAAYGPQDNPNWLIPSVIEQMLKGGSPQLTSGTQRWDYLYIDDAADGVLAVANAPCATGVFNLSSGRAETVRSVVETLRASVAPDLPLRFGAVPFGPNQIMHMEGDNQRLTLATGWHPSTSLGDGLALTVAAIRAART